MNGDFPPNVVELIQRNLTQFGRVGATKVYQAPALAAPIPVAPIAGTPSNAGPVNIRFREPGTVIALYGQELRGTNPSLATTWVRIQIGGQEDLFTDGQSGVWVPMLSLFPSSVPWFPLWRRAIPGVDWTFQYQNFDTGSTASPTMDLAFIADADLSRNISALRNPGNS